jgi:hypothetical protein
MVNSYLSKFVMSGKANVNRFTLAYGAEMRISNPLNLLTVLTEINIQPFLNSLTDIFERVVGYNGLAAPASTYLTELINRSTFQLEIRDDKNSHVLTLVNPFTARFEKDSYGTFVFYIDINTTPQTFQTFFVTSTEIYLTFKILPSMYDGSDYSQPDTELYTADPNQILTPNVFNVLNPTGIKLNNLNTGTNNLPVINQVLFNGASKSYFPLIKKNTNPDFTNNTSQINDETLNFPLNAKYNAWGSGYLLYNNIIDFQLDILYPKVNIELVQFNEQISSEILGK